MTYKRQATILLAVPIICNAFTAPSRNFIQQSSTLTLESHHKNRNNELESSMKILSGGLAAFILGLGTAANVALAAPADLDMNFANRQVIDAPSIVVSIGAPRIGGGGSFDTMDFSLPSYSDATIEKSGSDGTPSAPPQLKNPFGDLKLPEANVQDKVDAAEEKAAKEKANTEEKALKEKTATEQKASAEATAAEQKRVATEKAEKAAEEKAARREAEKVKQDEYAASLRKTADEKAKKEAQLAEEKAQKEAQAPPPAPKIVAPAPKVSTPSPPVVKAPEFKVPEFKAPDIKAPEFKAPEFKAPELNLPSISTPKLDLPSFSVPKVNLPSFSVPKLNVPSLPKIDMPAPPKLTNNAPSFDVDKKAPDNTEPLVSQEVRDEKARDAKSKFKRFDQDAKEIESKAREARNTATIVKKEAQIAKNEACKTRFGGKVLCIRSWGSGY